MRIAILAILSLFLLAACSSNSNDTSRTTTSYAVKDVSNEAVPTNSNPVREFTMIAKNWDFDPSTITVNKGDKVIIHITSVDVDHGFILPDFNVNVKLKPGETVDAVFIADKTGTFDFHCNVYCGSGHREMEGQLIIE